MDHLSFIFSLLLIVSVTTTTFGSEIKANNPNGEELEDILKRSHNTEAKLQGPNDLEDQDSEMSKRQVVGTIIAGAQLTLGLLQGLLGSIGNVNRKLALGIDNESGFDWEQGSTYYQHGTADENLPYDVPNGYAVLYGPRKKSGPTATGAVGVVAYYIKSIDKTISVMFSVPFDYNLYENKWNAKLYPGNKRASKTEYKDLYHEEDPFSPDGWHDRSLGSGLKV